MENAPFNIVLIRTNFHRTIEGVAGTGRCADVTSRSEDSVSILVLVPHPFFREEIIKNTVFFFVKYYTFGKSTTVSFTHLAISAG
ncbi:hypothetical protein C0557_20590 [Kosakonia sp. MUSA4]|nr:hypothetical protein C0557_20590 [Kosakonia sp. MUSA4]